MILTLEEAEKQGFITQEEFKRGKALGGRLGVQVEKAQEDDGDLFPSDRFMVAVVEIDPNGNPRRTAYLGSDPERYHSNSWMNKRSWWTYKSNRYATLSVVMAVISVIFSSIVLIRLLGGC